MKLKKLAVLILTFCICVLFCGCDLFNNANELVAPPALTGNMAPIADALYDAVGSEINLEYPASGERRAAIVLEDIKGDGNFIAFAFYSTSGDEMTTMHINAICQEDGNWKSVSDQTIVATGVDRVDFCDLNKDGMKEIIVGWDVNGVSEKQLSVITFDKKILAQKLLQSYTGFMCCDLNQDGTEELFVHLLNTTDQTNNAMVYNYGPEGIAQTTECRMDGTVKSASEPKLSTLSNGTTAIYIDEIKGVGAVTEVLFITEGEIVNPLLDKLENTTLRAASLTTRDINGDNKLEIPTAADLPNVIEGGEKLYYTNWSSFDGEKLTVQLYTVVNTVDGYYFEVPNGMVGKMAARKDIESHKREFYYYDAAAETNKTGDLLFTIIAMSASEFNKSEFTELSRKDNTVFAIAVTESAKAQGISVESIKNTFNVIS